MNFLGRMKNSILRTLLLISAMMFLLCALLLDSESPVPLAGCVISGAYMVLFFYVNDRHYEKMFRRLFCEDRW